MSAVVETRQGTGFPDWVIVRGSDRLFDWYNQETVTELSFVHDGQRVRLAVCDRTRLVIRSAALVPVRGRLVGEGLVNLATVPGLVRRFYGSDCFGHTEYRVAAS